MTRTRSFTTLLCLLGNLTAGCAAPILSLPQAAPPAQSPIHVFNTQEPMPTHGTAKEVFLAAQAEAEARDYDFVIAHVQGVNIPVSGHNPPNTSAGWIFSFIHLQNPQLALKITALNQKLRVEQVPAKTLAHPYPLEDRAWNIDSPKAIQRLKHYAAPIKIPVTMELTQIERRVVWKITQIDQTPFILDAMRGTPYTP